MGEIRAMTKTEIWIAILALFVTTFLFGATPIDIGTAIYEDIGNLIRTGIDFVFPPEPTPILKIYNPTNQTVEVHVYWNTSLPIRGGN
jgi:hypothetical protein